MGQKIFSRVHKFFFLEFFFMRFERHLAFQNAKKKNPENQKNPYLVFPIQNYFPFPSYQSRNSIFKPRFFYPIWCQNIFSHYTPPQFSSCLTAAFHNVFSIRAQNSVDSYEMALSESQLM